MGSKQVIIELRFQSIDVVVFERGQRTSTRRLPVSTTPDPIEWATGVRRAASTLRKTVQELGLEGTKTIVLYRSPTQAAQNTINESHATGVGTVKALSTPNKPAAMIVVIFS